MKKANKFNANQIDFAVERNRQNVPRGAPRTRELGGIVSVDVGLDRHAFGGFHVPNPQSAVTAKAAQILIFRIERDKVHGSLMARQRSHNFAFF